MIWQDQRISLNRVNQVGIIAEDASETWFSDLFQLRWSERGRLIAQFVPEPVAYSDAVELWGNDAGKRGAKKAAR